MYEVSDDIWKVETCGTYNVLVVKLHIDIVHLVGHINTA